MKNHHFWNCVFWVVGECLGLVEKQKAALDLAIGNPADFALVNDLLPDFLALGFQIRNFGKNTLIVEGVPADIAENNNLETILEQLIEDYKNNMSYLKLGKRDNLARTLAKNAALKAGNKLSCEEMNNMIDQLFACNMPNASIGGKQIVVTFTLTELAEKFGK